MPLGSKRLPKRFQTHPAKIYFRRRSFSAARASQGRFQTAPRCRCDVSIFIYSPSSLLLVEFSGNRPRPLDAFHGSRSVPRPPRRCVSPLSRATGGPVALLSEPRATLDATNWQCLCRWSDALLPPRIRPREVPPWPGGSCAQSDNRARLPSRAPHRRTAHTHPHTRTRMRTCTHECARAPPPPAHGTPAESRCLLAASSCPAR